MVTKQLVLLLVGLQILRVSSYKLTMSPHHVRQSRYSHLVNYTCTTDVALIGCQFMWRDVNGTTSPVLDLNRGPRSNPNSTYLFGEFNDYRYSGRGLEAGDCGITLDVWSFKEWIVSCRVKAATGGWKYAWADLFAENFQHLPTTVPEREAVVLPGGEARLVVKTEGALGICRFQLPGSSSVISLKHGDSYNNRILYHGAGTREGECGIALVNVTGNDNGPVVCFLTSAGYSVMDQRFMVVVVASHPSAPVLNVTREGNNVTATCEVKESRPIAELSWLLDDNIIRQDSLDDSPTSPKDEWRWPWMRGSTMQRLTLKLQPGHHEKVLKCRVSHVTLKKTLEVGETISFTAADPVTDTSCPKGEVHELLAREAGAAARTAYLLEEAAKVALEDAKVTLRTSRLELEAAKSEAVSDAARVKVVETWTREAEAWANNAQEELVFERERRGKTPAPVQSQD